jgi:hypothetical protein
MTPERVAGRLRPFPLVTPQQSEQCFEEADASVKRVVAASPL